MTIYRSDEGHQQIRNWCDQRLADWEHPHERRVLETDLGPTHVVTSGTGPPVALLAGTNFAATSWLGLVATLSADHTVHAVDLPGQPGLSAPARPRRGRESYGRWLRDLLPHLSDDAVTLVGHSLGALVVLGAATEPAPPIARLLLLDPAGITRLSVSPTVLRPAMSWMRKPGPATSAALLGMMSAPGSTPTAEAVQWMTLVGRHVRTSLAPSPIPTKEFARMGSVPITVLSGRHDAFLPPDRLANAVHRRLPNAAMRVVDGAGHLLPEEQPHVIVEQLANPAASPR